MSLHNGIDTIGIATSGTFSKTFGNAEPGNLANLYASLGLLEDVQNGVTVRMFYVFVRNAICRKVRKGVPS